jgi:hypothetical protein
MDPKPVAKVIDCSDDFENIQDEGKNIIGGNYIYPGSHPWLVPVVGKWLLIPVQGKIPVWK